MNGSAAQRSNSISTPLSVNRIEVEAKCHCSSVRIIAPPRARGPRSRVDRPPDRRRHSPRVADAVRPSTGARYFVLSLAPHGSSRFRLTHIRVCALYGNLTPNAPTSGWRFQPTGDVLDGLINGDFHA